MSIEVLMKEAEKYVLKNKAYFSDILKNETVQISRKNPTGDGKSEQSCLLPRYGARKDICRSGKDVSVRGENKLSYLPEIEDTRLARSL